ncbi:hypothetical protein VTI74DRAFT_3393 [Chaetomium olivicolor]
MECHEPTPSRTRKRRRRSSSPADSNNQKEAPRRDRKRLGRFNDRSTPEAKRARQESDALILELEAEFEAERARSRSLSPEERLEEAGDLLRQKIKADPAMVVALEVSRSQRARCRANDDCIYLRANVTLGNTITTDYRICVHGVENTEWFGRTKHYYHVSCFSRMMDLMDLLPSKLKMDDAYGRWGLMVELWFEHTGRIDLDKIASFLEEFADYKSKHRNWNSQCLDWQLAHIENCGAMGSGCTCPAQPQPPAKPKLGDCTTEDGDVCPLLDVLNHPLVTKTASEEWWMD